MQSTCVHEQKLFSWSCKIYIKNIFVHISKIETTITFNVESDRSSRYKGFWPNQVEKHGKLLTALRGAAHVQGSALSLPISSLISSWPTALCWSEQGSLSHCEAVVQYSMELPWVLMGTSHHLSHRKNRPSVPSDCSSAGKLKGR